jgi:hypothetical protein
LQKSWRRGRCPRLFVLPRLPVSWWQSMISAKVLVIQPRHLLPSEEIPSPPTTILVLVKLQDISGRHALQGPGDGMIRISQWVDEDLNLDLSPEDIAVLASLPPHEARRYRCLCAEIIRQGVAPRMVKYGPRSESKRVHHVYISQRRKSGERK